jgi:hypothetical protein
MSIQPQYWQKITGLKSDSNQEKKNSVFDLKIIAAATEKHPGKNLKLSFNKTVRNNVKHIRPPWLTLNINC